jgi:indolepyruvate decarboxylase
MVGVTHVHRPSRSNLEDWTDEAALRECIAEATEMINQSRRPVILAGVEVHRFGLQDSLLDLLRKTNFPVASTLLGKSVISEEHPLYLGVYEGAMGRAEVQNVVESADCVIMLGCFMTDLNLGVYTANLDPSRTIYATSEKVSVRRHRYDDIPFRTFFSALLGARLRRRRRPAMPDARSLWGPEAQDDEKVTIRSLFQELNIFITDDMVVISDIGDSLFGSADLKIHRRTEFISPAYYTSMGFAVPAALGAQLADPSLRPVALVGDGAFQMTGLELSTIVRLGLNPIVLVLNNRGYSTERQIRDGPFNDITLWDFHKVPDLLGSGRGFVVHTVRDLRQALKASLANRESFSIIDIHLDPYDISPALQRLGEKLGKRIKGKVEAKG